MFDTILRFLDSASHWTGFEDVVTVVCYAGQIFGFASQSAAAGGIGG